MRSNLIKNILLLSLICAQLCVCSESSQNTRVQTVQQKVPGSIKLVNMINGNGLTITPQELGYEEVLDLKAELDKWTDSETGNVRIENGLTRQIVHIISEHSGSPFYKIKLINKNNDINAQNTLRIEYVLSNDRDSIELEPGSFSFKAFVHQPWNGSGSKGITLHIVVTQPGFHNEIFMDITFYVANDRADRILAELQAREQDRITLGELLDLTNHVPGSLLMISFTDPDDNDQIEIEAPSLDVIKSLFVTMQTIPDVPISDQMDRIGAILGDLSIKYQIL